MRSDTLPAAAPAAISAAAASAATPADRPQPRSELVAVMADLGEAFGLSRPAGQCLATVWRAGQAPCADDLVAALGLSRSNISTALKELRGWGLISVARSPGDRREYFVAAADPGALVRQVLLERERRVLAPALDRLHAIPDDARAGALAEALAVLSDGLLRFARPEGADSRKKKKKSRKD